VNIRTDINETGLTNVIMNIEGIDHEIGIIEEHPTAEGYFRAFAYDGSLLQTAKENFAFYDFEQAKNALIHAYDATQK
jgi:hypothetical protein